MALHFRQGVKVRRRRAWKWIIASVLLSLITVVAVLFFWYQQNLAAIDKSNDEPVVVTIAEGMNDAQVGALLDSRGLIKSAIAYEIYVRLNGQVGKIQAGSYTLSRSMNISRIVNKLASGEITVDLLTILPGKRIDELRQSFIDAGFSETEVDEALDASQYEGHPALRAKPPLASLEGYLYPESFQRTATTPLKTIIEASLDEMAELLNDSYEQEVSVRGLTLHDAVILASIVEKEVNKQEDKPIVSQVFQTRLSIGMMLGSDVTAYYGAETLGLTRAVSTDTPYNTRLYTGLPPGPISNVSQGSLAAIAAPAASDYLYFVAGDDGVTYFSRTLQEHEALTTQHCIVLCAIP